MHVDREEEWVDHHTFFFSANTKRFGPHHCSFEVDNPDIQAIGHDVGEASLLGMVSILTGYLYTVAEEQGLQAELGCWQTHLRIPSLRLLVHA
jgi:hypothetical protein